MKGSRNQPSAEQTMDAKLVSVIIPCHNAAAYVADTVASALSQTAGPPQVIVVDDGSTDGSASRLQPFKDRIILLRQPNRGRAAAVHAGVSQATGQFLAFLDADDVWHPCKLARTLPAMVDAGVGLTHTRITLRTSEGDRPCGWRGERICNWSLMKLLEGNSICCSSVIMRREAWDRLGGFDGTYWPCDDYHLWLRCAARYKVAFVDEPLVDYRVHDQQASGKRGHMVRQMARVVSDFLNDAPDVRQALSAAELHYIQHGRFIDLAIHYAHTGRQGLARDLLRWCVSRNPACGRAWRALLAAHLPWSMYTKWCAYRTHLTPTESPSLQ